MKPRMQFYCDGSLANTGNSIAPYSLLTYVMQLNRLAEGRFITSINDELGLLVDEQSKKHIPFHANKAER
tara:strand:+ start:15367 stop:15576 length:210 start_codon:yes stop_codon:yes gene_type:complete